MEAMKVFTFYAGVAAACLWLVLGLALWGISKYYRHLTGERLFFNPLREGGSPMAAIIAAYRRKAEEGKHRANLPGIRRADAHGIVLGCKKDGSLVCSPEDEDGHILAIGGTRSGKTAAMLIPTLRAWRGTAFVLDISGDISANARRDAAQVLAPLEMLGCYDVFGAVDAAPDEARPQMLQRLALTLLPDPLGASDAGLYFSQTGRRILAGALICYYEHGLDFCEICSKVVMMSASELLADIWLHGSPVAQAQVSGMRGANEKNIAGCKAAASDAVELFAINPAAVAVLHRPAPGGAAITPAILEQQDIILRLNEQSLELFAPLLALVTDQILQYLTTRPALTGKPILLALDEFARLGQLGNIRTALATLAKRRVRIMLLTQSLADLDLLYGQAARKVICDNCQFKAVLRATDPDTQEYFAKLVGKADRSRYGHSWGAAGDTMSVNTSLDYIISPEVFGTMGDNIVIISPAGYDVLQKAYYFKA